jgi:hypothetical protein
MNAEGPNRVGISLSSPENGNIQFPTRCDFNCLEFRAMDKVHKPSDSLQLYLLLKTWDFTIRGHTQRLKKGN